MRSRASLGRLFLAGMAASTLSCAWMSGGGSTAVGMVAAPSTPLGDDVLLAAAPAAASPSPAAAPRPAPAGDPYRDALAQAYKTAKGINEGKNADYIPVLAQVNPGLFGIALVTVQGAIYEIGDVRTTFSIQSVSKPFTLARAIEAG